MNSINRFSGSCVSDIDYSDIQSNQLVFPTLNARIFNKKGQGFIISNLPGNELSWGISDGFVIIGHVEYNGVLYIVSYSESLEEGEIGSYPAPEQISLDPTSGFVTIDPTLTGFVREYKPIGNLEFPFYTKWLRTDKFNFDLAHQVDVLAKIDYDESVNLYICDYKNPNIVINTAFDQNGVYTDRKILPSEFDGALNLITNSDKRPNLELSSIGTGGNLPPGNYFVYIRYATRDFNTTPFLSELGPIQIGAGNGLWDSEGVQEMSWLTNTENTTNKKIELAVTNVDTSYKYIEVGIIRYSSFTENGLATSDIYLIDKYYTTSNISTSGKLEITGLEGQSTLIIDEIADISIPYNISKSHKIVNKRYLGANWKTTTNYTKEIRESLAEFALLIEPSWNDNTMINDVEDNPYYDNGNIQYKEHYRTTDDLGYFREQIIPFGVIFVFKGGYTTEAFPTKGIDGLNAVADNDKGLCRADQFRVRPYDIKPNMDYVLKAEFDFLAANNYYSTTYDPDSPLELLLRDLVGYYIVRGERVDNLITQGILFPVFNGSYQKVSPVGQPDQWFNKSYDGEDGTSTATKHIPFLNHYTPGGQTSGSAWYDYYVSLSNSINNPRDKFALYSMDNMFSSVGLNETGTVYMDAVFKINEFVTDAWDYHSPNYSAKYQQKFHTELRYSMGLRDVTLTNVSQGQLSPTNKFVGAMKDGLANSSDIGFRDAVYQYDYYNRSMFSPKYIGVDIINGGDITTNSASGMPIGQNLIVNLYRNENYDTFYDDTISAFEPETEEYFAISQLIELKDLTPSVVLGGGDCFLQRTYFRQMNWFGYDDNPTHWDNGSGLNQTHYTHGLVYSAITENKVNTAMRNEVSYLDSSSNTLKYTYFPKLRVTGETNSSWIESAAEEDQVEAFQINQGYNKTETLIRAYGYDSNAPVFDGNKTNRIYYSNPAISGSVVDQFRDIDLNSYQDFMIESGEIIAIEEYRGMMIAITKNQIFQIFLDERAINQSTEGDNILGATASFISDRINILADYGSQHQWSILKTDKGIYGVDWLRRKIWRVTSTQTANTGRSYLVIEDLTESKFIQKWIYEVFETFGAYTDIVNTLDDNPVQGVGIVTGRDKKFDEVMFTILFPDGNERGDATLVFSELSNDSRGTYSATPPRYMNIKDDLYTVKPLIYGPDYSSTDEIYKHNADNYLRFYDNVEEFKLSFIVNGIGEKDNKTFLKKIFESLAIEMNDVELDTIIYETDYQLGTYDFKTTDIADNPNYIDYEWQVPVSLQTSLIENVYEDDSEMVGKWMKITLIYSPERNEEQEIYIKKVITSFDIIHS